MSLQRRLLVYLLLCAPIVWGVALLASVDRARHEVNELFDTEMVRLVRQVQATLETVTASAAPPPPAASAPSKAPAAVAASAQVMAGKADGDAEMEDLALAVWDAQGRPLKVDPDGVLLPYTPATTGFVDLKLDNLDWRVYYLPSPDGAWLVAAGQWAGEREELVWSLLASQMLPWLLVLPVLLLAMAWSVRQALAPVRMLTAELEERTPEDLRLVPPDHAPQELKPLVHAMNGLFTRIESTLSRERQFTAEAAHELRTPLAVLRAQWDVVRRSADGGERERAELRLSAGLDRMDRLVTQMLALARLEATSRLPRTASVHWPTLVEQVVNDLLPLTERRHIELGVDWPPQGTPVFPLEGDPDLVAVLLRNLMDNAARYAPEGSSVSLRLGAVGLEVENDGEPLSPAAWAQFGERFHRAEGQLEAGSGLGISIVQRVAALHGLSLRYGAGAGGRGVVARLGLA